MIHFLELTLAMFIGVILIISLPFFLMTNSVDIVDENGMKVLSQ